MKIILILILSFFALAKDPAKTAEKTTTLRPQVDVPKQDGGNLDVSQYKNVKPAKKASDNCVTVGGTQYEPGTSGYAQCMTANGNKATSFSDQEKAMQDSNARQLNYPADNGKK